MTDPLHPIHPGATLSGRRLRDAIMQQTEVVGGPGILVNYVNGKVVVSLKRQVVARVAGAAGVAGVFMGKIMEVKEPGGFNTEYMIQNLAETITTLDSDPPGGCTPSAIPGRCEGIPYVVPYNRFFDGGLADTPEPVLVDFHAALLGDFVLVGKVKNEVSGGEGECVPPVPDGLGKCECLNGSCVDGASVPGTCDLVCGGAGTGTWFPGECCNPEGQSDPEPAEYAIWITEDLKISTCPSGLAGARSGGQEATTILAPPQLIGETVDV